MNDFSIIEKIGILLDIVASSPLFFAMSLASVVFLIFFAISIVKNKRINKYVFIFFVILTSLIIFINYNQTILNILDNLFDSVFMALFFPNITVYVITLGTINFSLIYSFIKSKINRKFKITNIISAIIMDLFLILIVGVVSSNDINVYEELTVYSNQYLLVLLELNMAVFTGWILIMLLISASLKLKKFDTEHETKKVDMGPDIIFDN